jgi:hypothetical protein
MTHTLHRQGSVSELESDYVLLAQLAKGINREKPEVRDKFIKIGKIFEKNKPVSIMDERGWPISSTLTACFDQVDNVRNVLRTLKKENLGISIVVSGLISEIKKLCKEEEIELKLHTVHLSLGVFGKKTLSSDKYLKITTMCGHHCVSPRSIENYMKQIKMGKITIEEVAKNLSQPCVCGIVNTKRVEKLLQNLIS